ncbi:MAG: Ig-like domain-containing protein [Firmicutes bacterium]|nr:Ig-like domain-containing protein [Bacillota bacterium]
MTKKLLCLFAAACLLLPCGALAAEVDSDSVYCFTESDFSEDSLQGICILSLPDASAGTVMLGSRVLRSGDILTAEQITQMTFVPRETPLDTEAVVTYLPIYESYVAPSASLTISVWGKKNEAPVAEDSAIETYKNLENTGTLKATDPEGEALTYTLIRAPKRGTVTLNADGTFTYTPKKNKVGVDSFTYTATDPAGNVSREATVTITILKPTDSTQYSDTEGSENRFAAEWMKNTGLFIGETIGGSLCFQEDKTVSKGEFITMVMKALELPVTTLAEGKSDDWSAASVAAMNENGFAIDAADVLTRGQVAQLLYAVSAAAAAAPGMQMYQ